MTLLKYAAGFVAGAAALKATALAIEKHATTPEELFIDTDGLDISIHVATLNEEHFIEDTLRSLVDQSLAQAGDARIIVLDSNSKDRTVEIAEQYADDVWQVPRGKLSARHHGYLQDTADIVASADADTVYPKHWLQHLVASFHDPEVVATHGPTFTTTDPWHIPTTLHSLIRPLTSQVPASNFAIRRDAYFESGGFDLSIDQQDRDTIWKEEEFRWPNALRTLGTVQHVSTAGAWTSMRNKPFSHEHFEAQEQYTTERQRGVRF